MGSSGLDVVDSIYQGNPSICPKGHLCLYVVFIGLEDLEDSASQVAGAVIKPYGLRQPF